MKRTCIQNENRASAPLLPSFVDLYITQGSYETFEAILLDGDAPVNLTNDTVKFSVRDRPQGTLKLQKINLPGTHTDPTNGRTDFIITDTDIPVSTDGAREWVFEVRRINPFGQEFVHIQGCFFVLKEVGD
jgi:hypothetical protein